MASNSNMLDGARSTFMSPEPKDNVRLNMLMSKNFREREAKMSGFQALSSFQGSDREDLQVNRDSSLMVNDSR